MILRSNRQNMFTMYKKYIYVFCDFWQKLRCSWDYVISIDNVRHRCKISHPWLFASIPTSMSELAG